MQTVSQDLLEEVVQRLVDEFHPEQIILFGSYAWGAPTQGSDLDLLVIVSDSDIPPIQRAISAHHCLGDIKIPKDVLVKTRAEFEKFRPVRASLEHKISEEGRVVYESSKRRTGSQLANEGSTRSRIGSKAGD